MSKDDEILATLDLDEPTQEIVEWAKEHLNEDPETRCQKISELRDMIYARGECTPLRMDDTFLLRFLRARFFVVEKAHRLFVNYHDFRENSPQFFENVDLHVAKQMAESKLIVAPPFREGGGRRMIQFRFGCWNPEEFTINQIIQSILAILEVAHLEPRLQILGGICLFDFGGLSMQHVWHMTPSIAHTVMQIMVTAFPVRIHALHIVYQSYVFDALYKVFKPFLNEAMKEKIFFHGEDMESLHKHIDPKYLSERYGGIHPDYSYHDWINNGRKNQKIVEELHLLGYQDSEIESL